MSSLTFKVVFTVAGFSLALSACHWHGEAGDLKAGVTVKNGGDTVNCKPDPALKAAGGTYFEGFYNLDYLRTYNAEQAQAEVKLETWEAYRDRLSRILKEKLPAAGASFDRFTSLLGSSDPTKAKVWQASSDNLLDFQDEDILQDVKPNCKNTSGGPDISQMVLRQQLVDSPDKVFYLYDAARLAALKAAAPMQYSFLVTHEWLWDLLDTPWSVATFNRLMHSNRIETMTPAELATFFADFGVTLSQSGFFGETGPKDGEMRQKFNDDITCVDGVTSTYDFLTGTNFDTIPAGGEKTYVLASLDANDAVKPKVCGMALIFGHRSSESTGTQSLEVKLTLSNGVAMMSPTVVQVPAGSGQTLFMATCNGPTCVDKAGELKAGLFYQFQAIGRKLTIRNTSSKKIDIVRPRFVLGKMQSFAP